MRTRDVLNGNPHVRVFAAACLAACLASADMNITGTVSLGSDTDRSVATVNAGTYRFIISGYPAANTSYSAESPGTSLETAMRTDSSSASSLEARYRTWDESNTSALRSDKYHAFSIIIR